MSSTSSAERQNNENETSKLMSSTPEPERRTLAGLTAMDTSAFDNLPKNDYTDNVTIKYAPFFVKANIPASLQLLAISTGGSSAIGCFLSFMAIKSINLEFFIDVAIFTIFGTLFIFAGMALAVTLEYFRSFTIKSSEITHQWLWRKKRFTITPDTIIVLYNPAGHRQRRLFLLDTRTRKHVRFYFGGTTQGDRYLSEIMQHLRRLDLPYETRPLNVDSINGPQQEKYLSAYSPWEIWSSENFFTFIFLIIPVGFIAFMVTLVLIISHFQN